jgi:hypothetical protein
MSAIVFLVAAKKLRMVKFYNKQLKKPSRNGKIENKNLNSRAASSVCRIRNAKHTKTLQATPVNNAV